MDFFKSVFSNDLDLSNPPQDEEDEQGENGDSAGSPSPPAPPATASDSGGGGGGAWRLGGLIKTFASKSESVIQTYRRDLEELGSGLKKETAAIREAATRAIRDLPESLEVGASVAQVSLESVGQAIDDFSGSVADIISHGKEALLSMDSDTSSPEPYPSSEPPAGSSKRYSRFEAQILTIQSNQSTFLDEPEDPQDYQKWNLGFHLVAREEEIEALCYENGGLESLFEKLVPRVMDYDTFWRRYYYRVHKLRQAEDARANLVKRVISGDDDEEELSWEVDDEDEEDEKKQASEEEIEAVQEKDVNEEAKENFATSELAEEKRPAQVSQVESLVASLAMVDEESTLVVGNEKSSSMVGKADDDEANGGGDTPLITENKTMSDAKADPGESSKDSDFSLVPSQLSMPEEDDLGWDEIDDLGENDDNEVVRSGGSPSRVDLHKRLNASEDNEDLSWDIDDDDEPVKP